MADRIKGINVVIGGDVTGLSKALQGVNKQINSTQSQLKDVERLLKLNPNSTELLAQKQRLLAEAVANSKTKLDALKEAEKQVQQQFERGEVSQQQYEGLQREIIAATSDLDKAKQAAYEFQEQLIQSRGDQALKEMEQAAGDFDRQLEKVDGKPLEEVGDAAQDAKGDLKDLQGEAQKTSTKLKTISDGAKKVSSAMAPVSKSIAAFGASAVATLPATKELRNDLAKLDANAEDNAVSVDAAREAWRKFAVQSGETDSAVEATSNLLQAGFTESNLQKAVEGLAGAAQRFPDTLKIESLADSLQETLATGTATGAFGELLDRLGIGAENFSAQLQACTTEAEKQNLVLETMASAGLNDTYEAWAKNNEAMIAYDDATLKLQESMNTFAEAIMPFVTELTQKAAEFLTWFAELDSGVQVAIAAVLALLAAISPVAGAISNIALAWPAISTAAGAVITAITGAVTGLWTLLTGTIIPGITAALQGLFAFIVANPIVAVIAAIVAAVVGLAVLINTYSEEIRAALQAVDDFLQGVFATDWTNVFGPVLGEPLNAFFATVKSVWDGVMQVLDGIITFVTGIFAGNWKQAWEGVKQIFAGVFQSLVGLVKGPLNSILGLVNAVIGGINAMIDGLNGLSIDVPEGVPVLGGTTLGFSLGHLPTLPYLAKGGVVQRGSAIVGEAGPELLTVGPNGTVVQPLTGSTTHNTTNWGDINVYVYGAAGQDVNELANVVMQKIETATQRRGATFA